MHTHTREWGKAKKRTGGWGLCRFVLDFAQMPSVVSVEKTNPAGFVGGSDFFRKKPILEGWECPGGNAEVDPRKNELKCMSFCPGSMSYGRLPRLNLNAEAPPIL